MTSNSANSSTLTPYASTESSLVVSRLSANVIARVATWEAVRRKREREFYYDFREYGEGGGRSSRSKKVVRCNSPSLFIRLDSSPTRYLSPDASAAALELPTLETLPLEEGTLLLFFSSSSSFLGAAFLLCILLVFFSSFFFRKSAGPTGSSLSLPRSLCLLFFLSPLSTPFLFDSILCPAWSR